MDELREYQNEGVKWLLQRDRAILADDMGLGKTVQVIRTMQALSKRHPVGQKDSIKRILIVAPKVALYVWMLELDKWWPDGFACTIMLIGHAAKRRKIIEELDDVRIILTTYNTLKTHIKPKEPSKTDFPLEHDIIIADEAHRFRNRKTATYKMMKQLSAPYFYMLSGTPATRGPQDLWALLNIIDRGRFSSFWRFVNAHCHVDRGPFGHQISGVKNPEGLRNVLKPFLKRRLKMDVAEELPLKTRQILPVGMTPTQRKLYNQMEQEMYAELEDGSVSFAQTSLTKLLRLRQILVTPLLLRGDVGEEDYDNSYAEYGAGIDAIAEHMQDVGDHHVVIFTPFAKAIPFIELRLSRLGITQGVVLKGGMGPEQVGAAIEEFKEKRGIAICTIKFAQSFSLETARVGYFLGYEFTPDENWQAEDRLHRLTSKNPVTIYYIQHKDTVDEDVLEILNTKSHNIHQMFNPQVLKRMLAKRRQRDA